LKNITVHFPLQYVGHMSGVYITYYLCSRRAARRKEQDREFVLIRDHVATWFRTLRAEQ